MNKVTVKIPGKTYPIYVGEGVATLIYKNLSGKVFIIADRKLYSARKKIKQILRKKKYDFYEIPVTAGESFKDFKKIYSIYGRLIKNGAKRDSSLIALGGGSIGDSAGFIAATFLRGISWVGVPTTLLAQVDSSIGGKTGINHASGKNLVGAFHQPKAVFCDINFLKTLSKREIISGLGETLKYGLIYNKNFYSYVSRHFSGALSLNNKVLTQLVTQSAKFKAGAVGGDEQDLKGIREVLNFGHTFGHALESFTKFKKFQHGEAVIWGMRFGLALSLVRSVMTESEYINCHRVLSKIPIPPLPKGNPSKIFKHMLLDKKVRDGKLHFVLLKRRGVSISDNRVTLRDLNRAWQLL